MTWIKKINCPIYLMDIAGKNMRNKSEHFEKIMPTLTGIMFRVYYPIITA
jgi:hypothetical protein